jgi:hypothetical protein
VSKDETYQTRESRAALLNSRPHRVLLDFAAYVADGLIGRTGVQKMKDIGRVVKLLQREHDRLTKQVKGVAAALEAFGATYGSRNGTRTISAAGRAKIAAAQRARWAKARDNGGSQTTTPKKRVMSSAAKKRIAQAQKKRWAAWKAKKATKP